MTQSYVEFTKNILQGYHNKNILIIGAGYHEKDSIDTYNRITLTDNTIDLINWIEKYRESPNFELFDVVIMSRVLEHLEVRKVDWYLYNLYTIMKIGAELVCIVPDMWATSKMLREEFIKWADTGEINEFKTRRLTYELLSEGSDVFWRHSLWTDVNSVKFYLQQEELFQVESIQEIKIDSHVAPDELLVISKRI